MDHYILTIITALIFKEGSIEENYLRQVLTGHFKPHGPSVEEMWNYFDRTLQEQVKIIYKEVYLIDLSSLDDQSLIEEIINQMSQCAGKKLLRKRFTEQELISMSTFKFKQEYQNAIAKKKTELLRRHKK